MTLAANGQMSAGGNVANRSINLELGRAWNFPNTALGSTALRNLAGVASGAIRLGADFYGKSNITVSLQSITDSAPFTSIAINEASPVYVELTFYSDGTWGAYLEQGFGPSEGNWATPTTAGVGASYWIRFTRTFFSIGFNDSSTPTTGWLQLNSSRSISVNNGGTSASASATYTIEIATDSAGSNIIASAGFIDLFAQQNNV